MKASEARALTLKAVESQAGEQFWGLLMERIRKAAEEGRSSITHPFLFENGIRSPTPEVQGVLRRRLVKDGYQVIDHRDPDPGYPGSGPYTEVSW